MYIKTNYPDHKSYDNSNLEPRPNFDQLYYISDACKEFSNTVSTAYGPNGMNKMVINHLEKLFVTNDAATIIRELEVEHPAAKMMILGSQMQEQEVSNIIVFIAITQII